MRSLGKYELGSRIASGGMAEIFHATLRGADGFSKEVCIKLIQQQLSGDPEFRRMFSNEALISGRLTHQNIVQVFDFDRDGDLYFIAMEYVFGKDLRNVLSRAAQEKLPFPVPLAARICMETARGLAAAHRLRGVDGVPTPVVHRDVSPHNVLLSFAGEVKLTDFGIARLRAISPKTRTGVLKGKFGYMSPEQAGGREVDVRSDVFSLGIILWETLTRRRLFTGADDIDVLEKVKRAEVVPPSTMAPGIPAELDGIVLKALSREPAGRYADAGEMETALERSIRSMRHDIAEESVAAFLARLFPDEKRPPARVGTEVLEVPETVTEELSGCTVETSDIVATVEDKTPPTEVLKPRAWRTRLIVAIVALVVVLGAAFAAFGPYRAPVAASPGMPAFTSEKGARPESNKSADQAVLPQPAVVGVCSPAAGAVPCQVPVQAPQEAKNETVPAVSTEPAPVRPKPGFLTVNADPWANVTIKGREIGQTPIRRKKHPSGEFTVVLENPELGLRRELKVTLKPGEELMLSVDMKGR